MFTMRTCTLFNIHTTHRHYSFKDYLFFFIANKERREEHDNMALEPYLGRELSFQFSNERVHLLSTVLIHTGPNGPDEAEEEPQLQHLLVVLIILRIHLPQPHMCK